MTTVVSRERKVVGNAGSSRLAQKRIENRVGAALATGFASNNPNAPNLPRYLFVLNGRSLHKTWDFALREKRMQFQIFDSLTNVDKRIGVPTPACPKYPSPESMQIFKKTVTQGELQRAREKYLQRKQAQLKEISEQNIARRKPTKVTEELWVDPVRRPVRAMYVDPESMIAGNESKLQRDNLFLFEGEKYRPEELRDQLYMKAMKNLKEIRTPGWIGN